MRIAEAARASGQLFEVHCDLLYQCDLDCEHCYLDDKASTLRPTAFWRDVIDQAADLGALVLLLSGGELFLRPDALELVAHARARGLFVKLKTHGGRLEDRDLDELARLGVAEVQVSYYSHRPEAHDAITRSPGSQVRTLAAIRGLRARGVEVIAAMPVLRKNAGDVEAVRAQMDEVDALLLVQTRIRVAQSGAAFARDEALDPGAQEEVHGLDRKGGHGTRAWDELPGFCAAGTRALYVNPKGEVSPCLTWPLPLGDLSAGDRLADLWEGHSTLLGIRAARDSSREICRTCHLRDRCDFCPGQGFLETGDSLIPARAVCETTWAKARAHAAEAGLPMPDPPPPLRDGLAPPAGTPRTFRILSNREAARALR